MGFSVAEKAVILTLKLKFQYEGQFYANFWFSILFT